jgi:hypothetical protein
VTTNATRQDLSVKRAWPTTHSARKDEWKRRREAALGMAYTRADEQFLGLFVATDMNGDETHRTRRVVRDGAFVIDVVAASLANGLSLDLTDDATDRLMGEQNPPDDAEGRARLAAAKREVVAETLKPAAEVWRRSGVAENAGAWAWSLAALGDIGWEVMEPDEDGATFAAHKMEHVELYYDRTGRALEAVRICFDFNETPDDEGNVETKRYERWLRKDETKTRIGDGEWKSRPHKLGVVPFVHAQLFTSGDPNMGLHAPWRLEDAEAVINSAVTQLQVIGTRTAAPWLHTIGFSLGDGEDASTAGKAIGSPEGTDAKWLEPALQGLTSLVDNASNVRKHLVETQPAFLFADASANASGTALSYRAGAYKGLVEPVQRRFWRALARLTALALAMEQDRAYDPATDDVFAVQGAPALPEDRAALADLLIKLEDADKVLAVDVVRALQGAGMVPADRSADEYLVELRAEADAKLERGKAHMADAEKRLADATREDAPDAGTPEVEPVEAAPAEGVAPIGGSVQQEALNGAQMEALFEAARAVQSGEVPRSFAMAALRIGLPFVDFATIEAAFVDVEEGSAPEPVPAKATPVPPALPAV